MLAVDPLTVGIFLFTQKLSVLINLHFTHGSQHSVLIIKIILSKQIQSEECSRAFRGVPNPKEYGREEENLTFMSQVLSYYNYIINNILHILRFWFVTVIKKPSIQSSLYTIKNNGNQSTYLYIISKKFFSCLKFSLFFHLWILKRGYLNAELFIQRC